VGLADAQLRLPFATAADAPPPYAELAIGSGAARFLLHLVRMRRAKRYIMRVRPDGALRVTIPRGGSRAEAIRFAERHLAWAVRQRTRMRERSADAAPSWQDGTAILLDGVPQRITIEHVADRPVARLGPLSAPVGADGDVRKALKAAMRAAAERELPPQLLTLAASHDLAVRRVTIRDQRSRWGSCSRSGTIALNYRLIQMPPAVRRYILLHELAHLVHQNHSRRYWTLVESMDPAFRESERWLKTSGQSLF
jgi:predicted metal-dependent hydrolase